MIDTHCHLTDPRLLSQLDEVLARRRAAGVVGMVTVGTDLADARSAIAVCHRHAEVRCGVGIHPNQSHEASLEDVAALELLQADPAVVALGEMGLDYFHQFSPRQQQAQIFEAQLDLAVRVGKPVIIHCREAIDDALAILRRFPAVRCVFHCFTGSADEAQRVLDAGHLLSFTGVVTFKNNEALREVVKLTPVGRMMVETDAPYLSPEPMRKQKINEPALVVHTAERIAQVKNMPVDELDRITTDNAMRFFGWVS